MIFPQYGFVLPATTTLVSCPRQNALLLWLLRAMADAQVTLGCYEFYIVLSSPTSPVNLISFRIVDVHMVISGALHLSLILL